MFKVSFKDDFKKVQTFNDKVTIVTLTGKVKTCPSSIPFDTFIWALEGQHWGVTVRALMEGLEITTCGKSVRSDSDYSNPVIGERIAEARAKINLYKFMASMIERIMKYYFKLMYGNMEFNVMGSNSAEPIDCLLLAYRKYQKLAICEANHLGKLIEES